MSGHHPYFLSHHAEKLENVFIENFPNENFEIKKNSKKIQKMFEKKFFLFLSKHKFIFENFFCEEIIS